jgi:hypothetical protein
VVDGVGGIRLPSALLARVTLPTTLHWVSTTASARRGGIVLQTTRVSRDPGEVFVFTSAQPSAARSPTPAEDHRVKAYHLGFLTESGSTVTPEMVRTTVERALQKLHAEAKGLAEYDREARTMIVAGSRDDIALADQVVEEMSRGKRVAEALPQLRSDIQRLRADLDRLRADVDSKKVAAKP